MIKSVVVQEYKKYKNQSVSLQIANRKLSMQIVTLPISQKNFL